ncbi:unnamed protein product [Menidia menidia]|uniref:(Atlantic silverside) hypothetical protein n=1 Tax=Menidia menidia TaxID=238744 RepID=A0A8S4AFP1_9TELE|nr:unnamed protein product [Menidia menidia]
MNLSPIREPKLISQPEGNAGPETSLEFLWETSGKRRGEDGRDFQRNKEEQPASWEILRQLIEEKVDILRFPCEEQQSLACEESWGREGLQGFAALSGQLTFHLQQLQGQTEQELSSIHTQRSGIEARQQQLTSELSDLQERKKKTEEELRRGSCLQTSTLKLCACRELQETITERLVQSESLVFQEQALGTLCDLLTQDLSKYQEEAQRLNRFTQKILRITQSSNTEETFSSTQSMQGKTEMETENHMPSSGSSLSQPSLSAHLTTSKEEAERDNLKKSTVDPYRSLNLQQPSSIKSLLNRFSGPEHISYSSSPQSPLFGLGRVRRYASMEALNTTKSKPFRPGLSRADWSSVSNLAVNPSGTDNSTLKEPQSDQTAQRHDQGGEVAVCPEPGSVQKTDSEPKSKAQAPDSGRDSVADSGLGSESELDLNKQSDSPSEEEPTTPKAPVTQSPKYQLFMNSDLKPNGFSGRDANGLGSTGSTGENSPRLSRWESNRLGVNNFRGSLESLTSRDWDTGSDRGVMDSPPRVFNSPYAATNTSMEYNPTYRLSEFKAPGGLSPSTSEMNLYSFNGRSPSPVGITTPTLNPTRQRFSAYDTLMRRRTEINNPVAPVHYSMRSSTLGGPNKKDYIEELTKELDACQKRNQFLEAESVEMEKERNQIRFEMRALLVNNEDLLRTNTQLNKELNKTREQVLEMDRERQAVAERFRQMEIEVKEAREVMVEANTQEYAFNFLEQSLKNKLQDAEENLEKQTQHAQNLSEKLWKAQRQLEELEIDQETKGKKTYELNSTVLRLETELGEALQASSQATAELNLQQKLRDDAQMRLEELEETLLEKEQELQRLQALVSRLQGEVSGKLIDKERTLEEEIQLRERLQLQCKQAERAVEDLKMELQSTNQAKDDLAKQLKQAQEKMIDLESDLEELQDSEQRWANKQKRAIEQTEQLQFKLIQEKDLNDQLEMEKIAAERQLRELRLTVDELESSRVQEDVISRAESRAKELENALRVEERNKATLTNTITKLERRINELGDQIEEEQRIATEQRDLMTQRMRSLKRQLNEAEEEASRKEAQYRHTQRELGEEREANSRLQRQLLDQHLQNKRKENLTIRQTLDNLRLDLSVDDEDEDQLPQTNKQTNTVTTV